MIKYNYLKSSLLIIFCFFSIYCSNPKKERKFSVEVATSFMKRIPNPDSIHWAQQSNHFSWQAGYIMFAMEKMWIATRDSIYYNYIKRYVDQQVDNSGNVPDFKNDALDNFLPGYAILFMYERTHKDKYKLAAKKVREGFNHYPRTMDGLFWAWILGQKSNLG
jgi:unsaturated rhamnogalacturonyl hydrolase